MSNALRRFRRSKEIAKMKQESRDAMQDEREREWESLMERIDAMRPKGKEGPGTYIKAMHYECEQCGMRKKIYLERGLEEPGEDHKPVPFTIRCKECGGMARHVDWNHDIHYSHGVDIPDGEMYFANLPDERCGVIRIMRRRKQN